MEIFNKNDYLNIMMSNISNHVKNKIWDYAVFDFTLEELKMLYNHYQYCDSFRYEEPNYWKEKIAIQLIYEEQKEKERKQNKKQ